MTTETLKSGFCGICNQPEGDDPKAHNCEFSCGACGQFFTEDEADDEFLHHPDFCDANDEIEEGE